MKYESPELNVIGLDAVDVIQTSGTNIPGGAGGGTGNENELPFNPVALDNDYNN